MTTALIVSFIVNLVLLGLLYSTEKEFADYRENMYWSVYDIAKTIMNDEEEIDDGR